MERAQMPLARYFLLVGGLLLALLFVIDAALPKAPQAEPVRADGGPDKSIIRIHSDRKWPERVVFDTSLPTIVPASVVKAEIVVPAPSKLSIREAFAQVVESKKAEPKPQRKRKIVKTRVGPPTVLVAQQPRFGFFEW
jgi:hypothetical protein